MGSATQFDDPARASAFVTRSVRRPRIVDGVTAAMLLFAAVVIAAFAGSGWPPPHIDTWAAIGILRTVGDRPVAGFGAGTVPKLGQLLLLAPAALGGLAWAVLWVGVVGVVAVGALALAQRTALQALGVTSSDRRWVLLFLLASPLVWRVGADGGVTGWSWSAVLVATAFLARGRRGGATVLLAIAATLRPEAVGAAAALAAVSLWTAGRWSDHPRAVWGPALLIIVVPASAAASGVIGVDLWWTGHVGATAASHAAFIREYARLEPPVRVQLFQHLGTLIFGLGLVPILLGCAGVARYGRLRASHGALGAASIAGWLAVVSANAVAGGPLFDRFLVPLVTAVAVPGGVYAARLWSLPGWSRRALLAGALALSVALSWAVYFGRFAGPGMREAERLTERAARTAARFPAGDLVAADQFVRAVAVGGGLRPWRTTFALSDPAADPCTASALVVRQLPAPPPGWERLARCAEGWLAVPGTPAGVTVFRRPDVRR